MGIIKISVAIVVLFGTILLLVLMGRNGITSRKADKYLNLDIQNSLRNHPVIPIAKNEYKKLRRLKIKEGYLSYFLMFLGGLVICLIISCIRDGMGNADYKPWLWTMLLMIIVFAVLVIKEFIGKRLGIDGEAYIIEAYVYSESITGSVLYLAYYDMESNKVIKTQISVTKEEAKDIRAGSYIRVATVKRHKCLIPMFYMNPNWSFERIQTEDVKVSKMEEDRIINRAEDNAAHTDAKATNESGNVDLTNIEEDSAKTREYMVDSIILDNATANELSQGRKIVYNGKVYNYYGYSQSKGYIVISTAIYEEGFMHGEEFNHMIPPNIGIRQLNDELYYMKIMPDKVEDHYSIEHSSEYAGFKCRYSVYSTGRVRIIVDSFEAGHERSRNLPSESEKKLFELGFKTGYDGDNEWDSRRVYINENVSLEDERFLLKAYKYYYEGKFAAPFDMFSRKNIGKVDLETDLKIVYVKICNTVVNMSSLQGYFEDIRKLSDLLEENGIDWAKLSKGTTQELIQEWENRNSARLPDEYKEFMVFSDGFKYGSTELFSLEHIEQISIPEEFRGYYWIGSYIGDGSMLLSDKEGGFYYGDHVNGVKNAEFTKFVEEWILQPMREDLDENGVDIPDRLNGKRKPILTSERVDELLVKYEEDKKKGLI